jgi:4-amino-4-deoxy-L-arabinose transferase-like glycosyltransferase
LKKVTKNTIRRGELIVLLVAGVIFLTSLISPPGLMDDVDAAQAQMARNILQSGDWVTMQLGGVKDLEKPPLLYWMIAVSYRLFGTTDTAARIPICLSAIFLCWLVTRMAGRALGGSAGLYAGLSLATSVGLWLFTRVLFHDVLLTLAIAAAMFCFWRALETEEKHWRLWSLSFWAACAAGVLAKGLIATVFPLGTALVYLFASGMWREKENWRRLSILPGIAVFLLIAAPWHVLATLRNPPLLDFSLNGDFAHAAGIHGSAGRYRGFFWFYFFNEHLLRFLNLRYPHDYDAVPRGVFWLLHLVWFFPWSAFLFRAVRLRYRGADAGARMNLLALCWLGVVMGFFTLSTRQEYYSMPAWPAFAILIGSAMAASGDRAWRWSARVVAVVALAAFSVASGLLLASWSAASPGDISLALARNPSAYTLSLGHMGDLTVKSFAYLRLPLAIAAFAFLLGAVGGLFRTRLRIVVACAAMMVIFFQAARVALIAFDPDLGSRPLAEALNHAPEGGLIVDDPWFEMSSLLFYTNHDALILNGRVNNLQYGSYAEDAPVLFIGDSDFVARWQGLQRWYVATEDEKLEHLQELVGKAALHPVIRSGGKAVYVNRDFRCDLLNSRLGDTNRRRGSNPPAGE